MIRLLIADDEPLVCVGLQSMLRWEDYNIEIAGTASNGRQAAEMIEKLQPDIVITDIKMPLKTGLELAAETYQKYGRIPLFIILTSYEEFSFVRQALDFQAVDYLIKLELTPESLTLSIKKALNILEKVRDSSAAAKSISTNQLQGLQEKFFIKLFNGLFEDRRIFSAQLDELKLQFSGSAFMVLNTEIEVPEHIHTGNKSQALYTSTMQMVRKKIEKLFFCYFIITDTRHFSVVFCMSKEDQQEHLKTELEKTINMAHNYFNVNIRMAMGFPVDDPFKLDESYLASRQALRETSHDRPLVFFGRHHESAGQLNYKQQVVANVQEYIRHNLDKHLSLNDLAAIFYLSPNYLSQLFTKYSSEGFVEYVTAERIKAAKEMLKKGTGPIYEIAEKTGFNSAFYFSKVFKKVEGISPREFQRRITQERS